MTRWLTLSIMAASETPPRSAGFGNWHDTFAFLVFSTVAVSHAYHPHSRLCANADINRPNIPMWVMFCGIRAEHFRSRMLYTTSRSRRQRF